MKFHKNLIDLNIKVYKVMKMRDKTMGSTEKCWYSTETCYDCKHHDECEMRKEYYRQYREHMDSLPSWE